MRSATVLSSAIVLLFLPAVSFADEPFDGKWLTTVSCEAARDALGYSFRFVSEVKNGKFRGLRGTEGKPSSPAGLEGMVRTGRHCEAICDGSHRLEGIRARTRYGPGAPSTVTAFLRHTSKWHNRNRRPRGGPPLFVAV